MFARGRTWLATLLVVLFALVVFLPTIRWGLPSREADRVLFGDRTPWTGREILELLERRMIEEGGGMNPSSTPATSSSLIPPPSSLPRGADVDANPILDRSKPVILNDTDAKRAEIVQRYRLMSKQPDEFIQFKALAEMSQRQGLAKLDPRLYQYGGLWIYPVGALVRGAMLVGWIESPPAGVPAKEFYLDRPEVFGEFYVVARAYSTMWGIVAALAIVWITRRLTGSHTLSFLAAAAFILLPVTRTAAHEAKPHLAGAALCLCAVIAATRYVESGRQRYALLAGALCGAAMAMVVSMLLSLAVLPMMAWRRGRRAEGGGMKRGGFASFSSLIPPPSSLLPYLAAFLVYGVTNPFLIYNALFHREILQSNLSNSTAMYGVGDLGVAFTSALRIAIKGVTLGGVILAALSIVVLVLNRFLCSHDAYIAPHRRASEAARPGVPDRGTQTGTPGATDGTPSVPHQTPGTGGVPPVAPAVGWLLAAPAACVLIQFILLAAGKPAEYARFGLVVFATMTVVLSNAVAAARLLEFRGRLFDLLCYIAVCIALGFNVIQFIALEKHKANNGAFLLQQNRLKDVSGRQQHRIALSHEPAPWSVMPLNLFRDQLILAKPAADPKSAIYDVYLYPSNLSSQVGFGGEGESVDWAKNRTQMILGSLPTTRPAVSPPSR